MANPEASSTASALRTCPLCDAPLPENNPTECTKCDWHVGYGSANERAGGNGRDVAAVVFSVIPGLGHIYKGHRLTGALYMLGAVFAVMVALVASTATAGFGLLLLPLYWIGIMMQVYWLEDKVVAKAAAEQR